MKISVVMPVYNAEKYILEALNSVENQTVEPYELIVVNDASKDSTYKLLLNYPLSIPMEILIHKENKGIGYSRQHGAISSHGDYVAFLSADDKYHPNFIKEVVKVLEKKPECGIYTSYYRCSEDMRIKQIFNPPYSENYEVFKKLVILWALEKNMFVNFSSVVIPKFWFNKISFEYDLKHGEDLIFLLDTIVEGYRWSYINKPLLYYRLHPKQGTRTDAKTKEYWKKMWFYLYDRLVEKLDIPLDIYALAYKNML